MNNAGFLLPNDLTVPESGFGEMSFFDNKIRNPIIVFFVTFDTRLKSSIVEKLLLEEFTVTAIRT